MPGTGIDYNGKTAKGNTNGYTMQGSGNYFSSEGIKSYADKKLRVLLLNHFVAVRHYSSITTFCLCNEVGTSNPRPSVKLIVL